MIKIMTISAKQLETKLNEIEIHGGHIVGVTAAAIQMYKQRVARSVALTQDYTVIMRLPQHHPYRDKGHANE